MAHTPKNMTFTEDCRRNIRYGVDPPPGIVPELPLPPGWIRRSMEHAPQPPNILGAIYYPPPPPEEYPVIYDLRPPNAPIEYPHLADMRLSMPYVRCPEFPMPSTKANESGMALPYMFKFPFEDRDHVDDSEFYGPGEEIRPNTLQLVKRFLKQVRESGGYDVDCVPPRMFNSPFCPMYSPDLFRKRLPELYELRVHKPIRFAIKKINAETGRNYKLEEIVKVVHTRCSLVYFTLNVKDYVADADADVPMQTLQALVNLPFGRPPEEELELVEWRRKPATSGA